MKKCLFPLDAYVASCPSCTKILKLYIKCACYYYAALHTHLRQAIHVFSKEKEVHKTYALGQHTLIFTMIANESVDL